MGTKRRLEGRQRERMCCYYRALLWAGIFQKVVAMLTNFPRCVVYLIIICVQDWVSMKLYMRALCVGLGRPGTLGLILWTIGVGSLQRGVLKKNICMGSRQWGEFKGGRRRKGRIFGVALCFGKYNNTDLSINKAIRSCISELNE